MTASMLTKNGTHTVGKDILTVVKSHHKRRCVEKRNKDAKGKATHQKRILASASVFKKKRDNCQTWTAADLKKVLMPLKRKGDSAMPSAKPILLALYLKWQSEERKQVHFVPAVVADGDDVEEDSDDNDEEDAVQVESV